MKALSTLARLYVDDLDRALPTICDLTGREPSARFSYGDVELAAVGGFLLVAGTEEALAPYRDVQSTVLVDDLDAVPNLVKRHGGEITSGPNQVPTGRNLTARHPGGAIIEYVEHTATT
ncbi:VOC family protein [Actinomadura napierensis]|uniref:VOC family protein n=1 Tax=Actinomadura napierensis TaxID=267854 RepID=A0ABN2ZLN8_9ACTN